MKCDHAGAQPYILIRKCPDCGEHIHLRLDESAQVSGFHKAAKLILQGKLPAQWAIEHNEPLSETQKDELRAIVPCAHSLIEEHTCSCSGGKRWRCNHCGRSWDYDIRQVR